jgi:hypothetical protein
LNTILRLSSELQGRWILAADEAAHCDVYLCDASDAAPTGQALAEGCVMVPVARRGELIDQKNMLARPIRTDDFVELLRGLETLPIFVNRLSLKALPAQGRARLLRWPAQTLLGGQMAWFKLATMLSKHAFSVADLSRMSGQSLAACEAFMQSMHQHELLEWSTEAASTPAAATVVAQPGQVAKRGFLFSIRRKLGLV